MKIGVLGGTFNPIHNGHLLIGEYARTNMNLDKIIYIPTGISAFKRKENILESDSRYKLLSLAIEDNPYFKASSMEMDRKGVSYTVDTLKELKSIYKDDEIYFIIGDDCLENLDRWKDFNELKTLCTFLIFRREYPDKDQLKNEISQFKEEYRCEMKLLDSPVMQISSTEIRDRVGKDLSIKYLTPNRVEEYIINNQLYSGDNDGDI